MMACPDICPAEADLQTLMRPTDYIMKRDENGMSCRCASLELDLESRNAAGADIRSHVHLGFSPISRAITYILVHVRWIVHH